MTPALLIDSADKLADMVQKLVATFAFLVAGIWVLLNYSRNRTHVPRLQVTVAGRIAEREDGTYLLVTCKATNAGLAVIDLPQSARPGHSPSGTALEVRPGIRLGTMPTSLVEAEWTTDDQARLAVDVFARHKAIEPALTISEDKLIRLLDRSFDAYEMRLKVVIERRSRRLAALWPFTAIVLDSQEWSAVAVAVDEDCATDASLAERQELTDAADPVRRV